MRHIGVKDCTSLHPGELHRVSRDGQIELVVMSREELTATKEVLAKAEAPRSQTCIRSGNPPDRGANLKGRNSCKPPSSDGLSKPTPDGRNSARFVYFDGSFF